MLEQLFLARREYSWRILELTKKIQGHMIDTHFAAQLERISQDCMCCIWFDPSVVLLFPQHTMHSLMSRADLQIFPQDMLGKSFAQLQNRNQQYKWSKSSYFAEVQTSPENKH